MEPEFEGRIKKNNKKRIYFLMYRNFRHQPILCFQTVLYYSVYIRYLYIIFAQGGKKSLYRSWPTVYCASACCVLLLSNTFRVIKEAAEQLYQNIYKKMNLLSLSFVSFWMVFFYFYFFCAHFFPSPKIPFASPFLPRKCQMKCWE